MADDVEAVVLTRRQGGVLVVTMNRPKGLNALDESIADGLLDALSGVAGDPSVRAVVLCGAGRSFMAGGDLARFQADLSAAPETAVALIDRFHAILRLIRGLPQPVIAAVHGPVAGGGVSLAFGCDLVIAAEGASFLSAYTRLGTSPDGGLTWSLTRALGPQRALAFVLLNDVWKAEDALRLGLVARVVPDADLMPTALSLAEKLARGSAGATRAAKNLIMEAAATTFDAHLDLEKTSFVRRAGSADFREGIRAFFEKRTADFQDDPTAG